MKKIVFRVHIIFLPAIICALLLMAAPSVQALDPAKAITEYRFDSWQMDNGLPEASVSSILQTRDGYLWLGTLGGLTRFDGIRFTVFNPRSTKGINSNEVYSLFESHDGTLWVATYGGLTRYQNGEFRTFTMEDGLPTNYILSAIEDKNGTIWMGTDGSGLISFREGKFKTYTTSDGLSSNFVYKLKQTADGTIWIGTTNGGLNSYKDGKFTIYKYRQDSTKDLILCFHETRDGRLLIGRDSGLTIFKDGIFTDLKSDSGLELGTVSAVTEDTDGNLWIGDRGALSRYYNGKFTRLENRDGLFGRWIMSAFVDREGNLWLGTESAGLVRFKDQRVTTFSTKDGLPSDRGGAIFQASDGTIWLASLGVITQFRNGSFQVFNSKEFVGVMVLGIEEGDDGSIWFATARGALRVLGDQITAYLTKDGLPDDYLASVNKGRDGSIWFGGRNGLSQYKDGKFTNFSTKNGLAVDAIFQVHETHDGSLWMLGLNGLNRFKDGKTTVFTTKDGLGSNSIRAFFEDADHTFWLSTDKGIIRYKDGKFSNITYNDGLFDDNIVSILDDRVGNLWITCIRGIFRVSKKELNDFADGKIKSVTSPLVFNKTDGMLSTECISDVQPASIAAKDGTLWFPTLKGLVRIDPQNLRFNSILPPVIIESVVVDRHPIDIRGAAQLAPGTRELEFHFTALSLSAPEKVKFKYKLEGFDSDWTEATDRRVAYYTNLPPLDYHFRVLACNNDGQWNEIGTAYAFRLKPHFYKTWLFYLFSGLTILITAALGYHLRVRQLKAREKELACRIEEATAKIKVLTGLLPICAGCKKIREDSGYWSQIETYIGAHTHAEFSHGICPDCIRELYPDLADQVLESTE